MSPPFPDTVAYSTTDYKGTCQLAWRWWDACRVIQNACGTFLVQHLLQYIQSSDSEARTGSEARVHLLPSTWMCTCSHRLYTERSLKWEDWCCWVFAEAIYFRITVYYFCSSGFSPAQLPRGCVFLKRLGDPAWTQAEISLLFYTPALIHLFPM